MSEKDKGNSPVADVAIQDAKAMDMLYAESTSNFKSANIYGGDAIVTDLMAYGAQGKFVPLNKIMEQGQMPYFKAYLDANPVVKKSITAYDGNIYHVPYLYEVCDFARTYCCRAHWITDLLDNPKASFDTKSFTTYYDGFYIGSQARQNTVTPKEGISITKKTNESIIQIQNNLSVKNGATLTKAFIDYINRNYDYDQPSQLFIGERAACDIDELIALFRCIKANPMLLTDGKAKTVWPFFTRKSEYREDLCRFLGNYLNGIPCHGSDSYDARWTIDKDGQLQYTYSTENMYKVLSVLSNLTAEGLIYSDCFDLSNKSNFRSVLWGTDASSKPSYGFMTFDWIGSSTSDTLNPDIEVILPPVSKINGVWQYYINNSRTIKNNGWSISVAGSTDAEIKRAATVMDYFFSPEGIVVQNYGILQNVDLKNKYVGPAGNEWPRFDSWILNATNTFAAGDISRFLRDWEGSMLPAVGYPKQIGFEYQSTSERGFKGWSLLKDSTTNFPSYTGYGLKGDNPNYYTLTPPSFSFTPRQNESLAETTSLETNDISEFMFNVVRYKTLGNAPSGATVAKTYKEYLDYFKKNGLDTYVTTYQAAFNNK